MKKIHTLILALFLFGCSSSQPDVIKSLRYAKPCVRGYYTNVLVTKVNSLKQEGYTDRDSILTISQKYLTDLMKRANMEDIIKLEACKCDGINKDIVIPKELK